MLIINADDFGLSSAVNRAISEAFERRLISSATVMPNMPGFEEACTFAVERDLGQHVGTHLVLTAGSPLTDSMRRCDRFCDNEGGFRRFRERGRVLRLDRGEQLAVREEFSAQIDACRRAGLVVTHLDSHQHVHAEPGIARIVSVVARESGVRYIRLARNCRPQVALSTRVYRLAFNSWLQRTGMAGTRFFGDLDDYFVLRGVATTSVPPDNFELMIHPALDRNGRIIDSQCTRSGEPLELLLAQVKGAEKAVSYSGARL